MFKGDSGGPMVCSIGDYRNFLAGIATYTGRKCNKGPKRLRPTYLTNVASWSNEIRMFINEHQNFRAAANIVGLKSVLVFLATLVFLNE